MNLPNKLTMFRIILALIVIFILHFPFDAVGIEMPSIFVNELLVINIKYIIAGVLFIIASITDYFDGKIARKRDEVTEFGRVADDIADKLLSNSVLIILSCTGFINSLIAIVIVSRDFIVEAIKMMAASHGQINSSTKLDKARSYVLTIGLALTLFYNLPFELWNLKVSDFLLVVASVLAIASGVEYFTNYKKIIIKSMKSDIVEKIDI
jgi:CDP-diacylglycerol--glycerol-3-phosphate 3-phosphatidyltransferase